MKTKQILFSMISLVLFSSFVPEVKEFEPLNLNYTISLSPSGPIVGNTEYNLTVSYANGNQAYKVVPHHGFTVLSKNPADVGIPNTIFRIRTNAGVTNIRGVVTAWVCSPTCNWVDGKIFLF